jgi:hypothetical protein
MSDQAFTAPTGSTEATTLAPPHELFKHLNTRSVRASGDGLKGGNGRVDWPTDLCRNEDEKAEA